MADPLEAALGRGGDEESDPQGGEAKRGYDGLHAVLIDGPPGCLSGWLGNRRIALISR